MIDELMEEEVLVQEDRVWQDNGWTARHQERGR